MTQDTTERRFTAADLAAGAARATLLKAIRPLLGQCNLRQLAKDHGTSPASLCRLTRAFSHLSDDQLTPENLATWTSNSGRSSDWELLAQDEAVCQRLKALYLLTIGASSDYMSKDRPTGSAALTLERFADDPLCPPRLAKALRKGSKPKVLMNIIRQITPAVEQRLRGPKHSQLNGTVIQRREMVEILEDETKVEINLGDWWVFDDMSTNLPFWFAGPEQEPLVGRQGLYGYDIRHRWLGVELIGTSRDSYTSAIILRFLRRLMQAMGKPRRGVVFERSVWQSRSIMGHVITASGRVFEEEYDRPGMSNETKAELEDGIKSLGLLVHYTHTPRGKEIEGGFNFLQRVFPTFAPEGINIGRHAGEFEHGAKQLRRARANSHHPEDLGFLHIDKHADLSEQAMSWINRRAQFRGGTGVPPVRAGLRPGLPDESEEIALYPTLGQLSQRDLAVFLPDHAEVRIRAGQVTTTIAGQAYDFIAPEQFAAFGNDYRVAIKFDRAEPTLGCAIYNRETSSANFNGYQLGEFICFGEYKPTVARFDWRPAGTEDIPGAQKKRYDGFVRTAFRAVGLPRHKAATARDGRGTVAEVGPSTPAGGTVVPTVRAGVPPGLPAESGPSATPRAALPYTLQPDHDPETATLIQLYAK